MGTQAWILGAGLLAALGGGCGEETGAQETDTELPVDGDGDGYLGDVDCNDEDATIFPGAEERCEDGVDNDCDSLIDGEDGDCP